MSVHAENEPGTNVRGRAAKVRGKTVRGKEVRGKKVRATKVRRLLRRPLESAEELDRLAAWVAERRDHLLARLRVGGAVAGILVLVNLLTTAFQSGVDRPGRVFSAIVIFAVAAVWTPGAVRRFRTHPRLLAAQRQLLGHRGLIADFGPDSLGDEIERLAGRIRKRLAVLERDDRALADAERRAWVLLAELAENEDGETTGLRERRRTEQIRLRSRLEAFRVALANIEVEDLLSPGFFEDDRAREALAAAANLLEDDAGGSETALVVRPLLGDRATGE